jgi:hypothetical protein
MFIRPKNGNAKFIETLGRSKYSTRVMPKIQSFTFLKQVIQWYCKMVFTATKIQLFAYADIVTLLLYAYAYA